MKLDKVCLTNGKYYDHCVSDERGFPDLWADATWVYVVYEIGEIKMFPLHRIAWVTPRADIKYGECTDGN